MVSDGLCGMFDGIRNTVSADENERWRVSDGESLFEKNYVKLQPWDENTYLCTCLGELKPDGLKNESICDAQLVKKCNPNNFPVSPLTDLCSIKHNYRKRRRRRDTHHTAYEDIHFSRETSFNFANAEEESSTHIKRTRKSAYDEVTAREECIQALNTTVFQLCQEVPDLDLEPYIDGCTKDAVMTNSMDWAVTHLEGVKGHCVYQVQVNLPLPDSVLQDPEYTAANTTAPFNSTAEEKLLNTSKLNAFSNTLLKEIQMYSCPNECSFHGNCTNGKCECLVGFADIDCSVDLSKPPVMKGIPDEGLCDLSLRKCGKTSVFGDHFVQSDRLLCSLTAFRVTDNLTIVMSSSSSKLRATRRSFAEVSCPLPDHHRRIERSTAQEENVEYLARGFSVSISNDGATFGDADLIVIYDSICVNCSKTGTYVGCIKDQSYCMRDGVCYAAGESYGCEICDPDKNEVSSWYKVKDCSVDTRPSSDSPKYWIIGVILGALIGIAVAVLCMLHFFKKSQIGEMERQQTTGS